MKGKNLNYSSRGDCAGQRGLLLFAGRFIIRKGASIRGFQTAAGIAITQLLLASNLLFIRFIEINKYEVGLRWVSTILIGWLCFLFWQVSPVYSQTYAADSLLEAASLEPDPNEKARIFLELARLSSSNDLNQAMEYINQASELTEDDNLLGDIFDQKGRIHFARGELDEALSGFRDAKLSKENAGDEARAASINNRVGVVLLRQKKHQEALEVFLESASFFEKAEDVVNLAMTHNNMAGIFADMGDYQNAVRYNELALPVFRENNIHQYAIITLTNLAGQYLRLSDLEKSLEFNQQAEIIGEELQDQYALGIVYNNFGQIYFERGEIERSLEYYEKSLAAKEAIGINPNVVPTYNNLGQAHIMLNQPQQAIEYLREGLKLAQGDEIWHVTSNLSKAFSISGQADSAAHYLDLTLAHRDSIFTIERQGVIDQLRTEYESERQELEIAQLEASQQQNRMLLTGLSGLFVATLIIGLLTLKNTRKKRIIAQQNEKLEKQHVEQLLKEQELIGINAMLEGQEKEREKIAEELHDTIGSSLATLKLYIESLDDAQKKEEYHQLHKKASHILEETYDEVRKIAHSKSAGVLIRKGLVPAVEAMAARISEARKIDIQVIGTGLEDRLENSVEISIFRSIQELLSNAVKHSRASEVVVQITQHDDMLNIIAEDNGIGFNPDHNNWGLGYTTIQNRMDDLDGDLTIDSSPGNGTTVILNISVD